MGSGASGECSTRLPAFALRSGWMLVVSDQPVIPYGWYHRERERDDFRREDMDFHPLDCGNPEGIEFACVFAGA